MDKRGESLTQFSAMHLILALVIAAAVFLVFKDVNGQVLNQIRADDLAAGINSMFLLEGDLELEYVMGEGGCYVNEENNQLEVYKISKEKGGKAEIIIPRGYDFGEQVRGKVSVVEMRKKGRSVVIR